MRVENKFGIQEVNESNTFENFECDGNCEECLKLEIKEEPEDRVINIKIQAVASGLSDFGPDINVTKLVEYHSGVEINIGENENPLPYDLHDQVDKCVGNIKHVLMLEYDELAANEIPVNVMITIETINYEYMETFCEKCMNKLNTWLYETYAEIYKFGYGKFFVDFKRYGGF